MTKTNESAAYSPRPLECRVMQQPPLYTARRCRNNGDLYGPTHGSMTGDKTDCGKNMDHHWWILTNAFDGEVTCLECIKLHNDQIHGAAKPSPVE